MASDLGRASAVERLIQGAVAAGLWLLLLLGAGLEPSPEGLGTHEQLGMEPCAFYQITGRPCPGCGLTTAFALMARGRPLAAVVVQPFGALLFMLALVGAAALSTTAALGRSWRPIAYRAGVAGWLYGLIVLWLASWMYKLIYGELTGGYGP